MDKTLNKIEIKIKRLEVQQKLGTVAFNNRLQDEKLQRFLRVKNYSCFILHALEYETTLNIDRQTKLVQVILAKKALSVNVKLLEEFMLMALRYTGRRPKWGKNDI